MGSFKGLLSKSCLIALVLVIGLLTLPVKPVQAAAASSVVRQPGAVCQLAAGMLYNEAYQTLRNLRVGSLLLDFINPAKRFNPLKAKKSKAYKAVTRLLIAAMVVGTVTCPPIVIRAPFRGQSRDFRVSRALAEGFDPADPNLDLEVENPSDPASCTTTTLYQDVDENTGEIFDFGDFQEMQFVYSEPFGSYPAASKFLREILAERASALMGQMSSWLPSDILPDTPLDDLSDFIDGMAEVPDQYNPSLGDIPGLRDIFELMANQTVIDFEAKFYNNFNHWVSGVLELPADQLTIGNYGAQGWQLEFHDGFHQWFVQADNDLTPTGFNYTQRVFVKEYFVPEFDVLYEIEDPNNPGVMLKVVADGEYEALEPGRADRSYTPPTAFEGSMEAYDNCDPDPKEFIQIPTELSLGIHYFPITAIDRAGNESDLFHVRINVIDSIPPDVNPPESIGIEVAAATTEVNFTDQGIGCTTYLCQNSQPDKQVFPPTYFDFATITPDYNCYASNTMGMEQPCDLAVLPVGEATEVRWEATDPSGNVENIIQYVAIREVGTNQPPEASGTTVTVAAGVTTPIRLQASDPEFDPLSWQINSLPALGQLEVNPEPQFQTRFSISGTMDVMSSIVKLDGSQGENAWNRILVADEGNNRLVEMDSFSAWSEPVIRYTHFLGNVRPSSILFYDYDNSNGSIRDERYLEDLLIADWSTGRIHTLNGPDNSPDSGYDISQWVSNPAHIAMLFDGSDARLFITDPDPVASTNGKLVILRISNFDRAIPANNWAIALEATIDMNVALPGFNPASITASDCNMLLLGDTDVDGAGTGARIATYYYLNNQPGNSGTDRVWDISSLTEDPPGDARPILGQRIELASRTGNCTNLSTWVADDASKEVIPLVLMDGGAINTSAAFRVGTEFVTIQNIESPAEEYFYVLSTERLSRYDINGVLDALVLLDVPNDNLHNFQQLNPGGKQFIDMSLSANGDLFILDSGIASGQNVAPGVMRLQVNSGFSQFTILAGDGSGNSALDDEAYALSYSPGASTASDDDWVYLVGEFAGLERMSANNLDNPIRLLDKFPDEFTGCAWCGATGFDNSLWDQILDVANDASGNVYFSDLLNRVHKFTDAGEYVGWLGRCDSGTDCDVANGRSYGFSCKLNSCSSTNDAGVGQGQFDFDLVAGGLISSMRPRYGRLTVDNQAGLIYVSDFIDHDGDTNTPRLPRIQSFSLSSGAFNSETRPDGEPGNLLSFLDPGDFTAVNDMAVFGNTFYVAEDLPLERLHVFDAGAFEANLEGATVNYIADSNTSGNDFFEYSVEDSFGAASSLAQVDITVVLDNEPPQLGCPADLIIEGTHLGGAQPSQFLQGEAGSVELADFLEGYTLTDNVSVPEATAVHDGPALFPLGETIVTFTATDAAGNQSVCSASVSVFDTIAPELASGETGLPDIEIEASAVMTPYVPPQAAYNEQVGPLSVTVTPAGPYPLGRTILRWVAEDGSGNQLRLFQNLTVRDTTAPVFGIQPPYPDQEAINGWGTPINFVMPGVFEAVELANPIRCMPEPNAPVASVEVEVNCQALDTSSNFAHLRIDINVVQSDDDGDGISNIVDTDPTIATGIEFSDQPLGGSTQGRIVNKNGFQVRVEDAWQEDQGVRITAEEIPQVTALVASKLSGAANGEAVEIEACNGDLYISGLVEGVDADGDPGPGVAIVSCQPLAVIAESGSLNLTLPGPGGELAHIHLGSGNGISWDGSYYRAPDSNIGLVFVSTPGGYLNVAPGQAVSGSRIFGIPAINIWGMLGLMILLGGLTIQEFRRRS